jgi:hypothetical protein
MADDEMMSERRERRGEKKSKIFVDGVVWPCSAKHVSGSHYQAVVIGGNPQLRYMGLENAGN